MINLRCPSQCFLLGKKLISRIPKSARFGSPCSLLLSQTYTENFVLVESPWLLQLQVFLESPWLLSMFRMFPSLRIKSQSVAEVSYKEFILTIVQILIFSHDPLVNITIAMERSTIFHGKIHCFYGHVQWFFSQLSSPSPWRQRPRSPRLGPFPTDATCRGSLRRSEPRCGAQVALVSKRSKKPRRVHCKNGGG